MGYQQQIAILRAIRKGVKAVNSGFGNAAPPKKGKQPKKGGACRKCPKLTRRRRG